MSVNRLPPVGRIRAVHLPEGGPRVPKPLTIEYSDRSSAAGGERHDLCFREHGYCVEVEGGQDLACLQARIGAPPVQNENASLSTRSAFTLWWPR